MPAMKLVQAVTRRPKRGARFTIADNKSRDLSFIGSMPCQALQQAGKSFSMCPCFEFHMAIKKDCYRFISFLRLPKLAKHLQKDEPDAFMTSMVFCTF